MRNCSSCHHLWLDEWRTQLHKEHLSLTLRKNVSLVQKSRRTSIERSFFAKCPIMLHHHQSPKNGAEPQCLAGAVAHSVKGVCAVTTMKILAPLSNQVTPSVRGLAILDHQLSIVIQMVWWLIAFKSDTIMKIALFYIVNNEWRLWNKGLMDSYLLLWTKTSFILGPFQKYESCTWTGTSVFWMTSRRKAAHNM
jgi:hypothetical protein